jgi:RNA polymerase sigma-70 factor (ECF subfamily)
VVEAGQDALSGNQVDEDSLVESARRNDMRAFEQLYRLHSGRIYALCFRLCNDREIAEDLTQESFVLAWRKLDSFRGESAFGSWLYRISTNVALSYLRKRKPLTSSLDYEDYEQVENSSPPEEQMNLEAAISKLPDGARMVFVLYSIEGYSHKEISSTLKIATGSSKAQLHRARQLLQGYLSDGSQ